MQLLGDPQPLPLLGRERAVLIGATLRIEPGARGGTRVTLELP